MKNKGNILPLLLIVVAAALVIYVAIQADIQRQVAKQPTPAPIVDAQTQKLLEQGTSDELSAIEKDLNETDLSGIDKELSNIGQELTSF